MRAAVAHGIGRDWSGRRVSERSCCVLANNASPMTFTGTNTWILSEPGTSAAIVVDPGPDDASHLAEVVRVCRRDALEIRAVLLTHGHLDHSEGAEKLASEQGAPLYSCAHGNLPDGPFRLKEEGPHLIVVSLPGHSSDSVGFCFPADQSIVSGDIVFLQSPTVICWPQGSLSEYLESLALLRRLVEERGYRRLLSAHGRPIEDPLAVIERNKAHREKRIAEVRAAIEQSASLDIDGIFSIVYQDTDIRLDPAVRLNIRAQLQYLQETNDPCLNIPG